ncbi:MAG: MBL fold metallo-hydrolase [Bdellovibrionales bacterium]
MNLYRDQRASKTAAHKNSLTMLRISCTVDTQTSDFKMDDLWVAGFLQPVRVRVLTLPHLKMCIDTARDFLFAYPMNHLFLTHAHIDHAGGLAYIVSQRGLMGLDNLKIYVHPNLVDDLRTILMTWEKLEGFSYSYEFVPVIPGDVVDLDKKYFVKPFQVTHRVPTQGYCVFQKNKRLKSELLSFSGEELAGMRAKGVEVDEHYSSPIFAYTGDTDIFFLDVCDKEVLKSKALFIDCTYFDEAKPVDHAIEWGHIHFFQVVENLHRFECEKLVLTHASNRYKKSGLEKTLSRLLTPHQLERVTCFP